MDRSRSMPIPLRARMRRGMYLLPNSVTTAALFCGFFSILSTAKGDFVKAAWFVLFAMIFDGLDGRVARATHTQSEFGVQYDSLSDLVSFGAAPALLFYHWALEPFGNLGWMAAFTFLACAALRLARFNVHADAVPSDRFEGLPSPAAAVTACSFVLVYFHLSSAGSADLLDKPIGKFLRLQTMTDIVDTSNLSVLIGFYVLAFLMISQVPYTSFKKMKWVRRHPYAAAFGLLMILNVLVYEPQITVFGMLVIYILSGPTLFLLAPLRRPRGGTQELATRGGGGGREGEETDDLPRSANL